MPSSRGSSWPIDWNWVSCLLQCQAGSLPLEPPGKPLKFYFVCLVTHHIWLFVTPWTVACQAPLSMGIVKARILEWVAIPSFKVSSQPRDWTRVSRIAGRFFTFWAIRGAQKTGVDSLSLLQEIFLVQDLNWGLLSCRWILYQMSYQGMSKFYYFNAIQFYVWLDKPLFYFFFIILICLRVPLIYCAVWVSVYRKVKWLLTYVYIHLFLDSLPI